MLHAVLKKDDTKLPTERICTMCYTEQFGCYVKPRWEWCAGFPNNLMLARLPPTISLGLINCCGRSIADAQ